MSDYNTANAHGSGGFPSYGGSSPCKGGGRSGNGRGREGGKGRAHRRKGRHGGENGRGRGREGGKGRGRGRGRGGGGDSTGTEKNFVWVKCPIQYFALRETFKGGFPRLRRVRVNGKFIFCFTFSDIFEAAVSKKERMRLANLLNKQSGVKHRVIDLKTGLGVKVNVYNSVQGKNFTPFVYLLSSLDAICKICGIDLPPMWSREDQAASIVKQALLRYVKQKKFAAASIVKQTLLRYVKQKKFAAAAAASKVAAQVAAQAASHAGESAYLALEARACAVCDAAEEAEAAAAAISATEVASVNAKTGGVLFYSVAEMQAMEEAVAEAKAAAENRFGTISDTRWGDSSSDEDEE